MTEAEAEQPEVFQFLLLIGGEPHSKYVLQEQSVEAAREIWGMTDEEIKIETIH